MMLDRCEVVRNPDSTNVMLQRLERGIVHKRGSFAAFRIYSVQWIPWGVK